MKKQILFIAVLISAILFSCSKEKIETPPATETTGTAGSTTVKSPGLVINTLNIDLLGRYEFDGNLKDTTGKLEDGYPTGRRVLFTTDRKGQASKAIRFNAAYGVDIFDVPATPQSCSFSAWVKYDTIPTSSWLSIVSSWKGFSLQQFSKTFCCIFWDNITFTGQNVSANPIDNKWHHIAATRDNTSLKVYIDGVLIGTSPTPANTGGYFALNNYSVGYGGGAYWKGSIDDLRFYKRVLTSAEVSQLANL